MLLRELGASFRRARAWLFGGLVGLLTASISLITANWLAYANQKDGPSSVPKKEPAGGNQSAGKESASDIRRDSAEKIQRPRTQTPIVLEPFDDLEDLLKDPPPGVDAREWERLRQLLRRQREELRRMLEQFQDEQRRLFPPPGLRPPLFGQLARRQPRLGVVVEPLHPALREHLNIAEGQGVLVREVLPNTPAARVGIKLHDILLEIGGKAVPADPDAFVSRIRELPAGKAGKVVVLRKGKKETLDELELPEVPLIRPRLPEFRIPPFPAEPLGPGSYFLHVERSGDGRFHIQYRDSDQTIRIAGSQADGKTDVSKIEITEGRETKSYDSLEALPAATRDKVSKLLDSALKGRFPAPNPQPKRFD